MGCWNETCMASRLPIYGGDPILFIPLAGRVPKLDSCYPDGAFVPIVPPIRGEYDEYGGLADVRDGPGLHTLRSARFFVRQGGGPVPLELPDGGPDKAVNALLDAVRSDEVTLENNGRRLPVYTALLHVRFLDMALEETRHMGFPDDPERDYAFLTRQTRTMKDCLAGGSDGPAAVLELMRLQAYLNSVRVAWAPSTGSGSQNITDGRVLRFHRAILEMAEDQAMQWSE